MNAPTRDERVKPTCPRCCSREISEIASTRIGYAVVAIAEAEPVTGEAWTDPDARFGGFRCDACCFESGEIADFVAPDPDFEPIYEPWRHGGWYVCGVRHRNGGTGCVSRNYPDRKWRIVCDSREGDHTYRSRDEAARAEYALTSAGVIE
jgi:hypothetical protein